MFAPSRRSRRFDARRRMAALVAAAMLVAACGDGSQDDEVTAPADDGAVDGTGEFVPDAGFETLEPGELVPGVRVDAPIDEGFSQGQPVETGSVFMGGLGDQEGAITVNVEFGEHTLDELLGGIEAIVGAGEAEVVSDAEDIEVEGADEAARVSLQAPGGGATATGVFAIADGDAIAVAVEVLDDAEVDVEAIIASISIDPSRLRAEL